MAAYHKHLDLNARLALVTDPKQAIDLENESRLAYEEYYQYINNDLSPHGQSDESKCIIANSDADKAKAARSHNAASYYKVTPECLIFRPKVPISPYAYPIVVRPPLNCEHVFNSLLEAGVYASRLIDKWDHLPKGDERFAIEHTFMDQHLLLPVGEEVTYDDIRRVGTVLKECVNAS